MFTSQTTKLPTLGLKEIKDHLERCHELHLIDPELNDTTDAAVASMKIDMAILIGMTVGLLASKELNPTPIEPLKKNGN